MLAVDFLELVTFWALPLGLLLVFWVATSTVVFVLVRSRADVAFKHDLLRKFEDKRDLPSGRERLSFPYIAKLLAGDSCIQAAFLYRISHYLAKRKLRTSAEIVYAFSRFATHTDLSPWASIGPGLYLYHGLGTVVGKGARVGERALICQGVTIGGRTVIGDEVKVWAGAQILAGVSIGDRSEVGANAVVMSDFPDDSIIVGIPARIARKSSGLNRDESSITESGDAPAVEGGAEISSQRRDVVR